ncbi:MAG TPA: MMPL family transporter, partial [Pirellulales bacterium]|nr:MMPL family transporter [Pirellulales bacterium]
LEFKLLNHVNLVYAKPATLIQAGLQKLFPPKIPPEPTIGEPLFASVETGRTMLKRLTDGTAKLSEEEAQRRLAGLFVGKENHQQSCAIVTLTAEAKRDLRHTLDSLYELLQKELALPRSRVKLGGPPVDNVAISTEGEKTLARLFGPAGIVGLALAYWCLRSTRLTMMVFVTALYAGAISLSLVYYSGSAMNAILLTMPAVVYVAGISGAIHFANYYRGQAVEGGVEGAPARAVQHAWIPCTLSGVTSAAGLASLYTSELIPIKMFGVYTALGVLTTLGLLFLFLPAWMQVWPMRKGSALDGDAPQAEELDLPIVWQRFLGGVLKRWYIAFAAGVALLAVCGYGLTKINTSIKLTKLFSSGAEIIKNYEWLESNLGPLVPMEVVLRFDNTRSSLTMFERAELVDRVQKSLVEIEEVGNTMSAVTFAPPLDVKKKGPIRKSTMRDIWNKRLEAHRQEYIEGGFLANDGDSELWRISARVGALNDVDYGLFLNDLRAKVEPVLAAERTRILTERAKAAKEKLNKEDVAAASAPTADDPAPLGIDAVYTGLVPVVYKAQYQMLVGLGENFIYDLLTIAGVMTVVFRDLSAGLILLVPSVFPVMVVFGLMGWFGVTIDVGTIMTPTVALGVSVDDVVHFLIWYRRGLSEGKTRPESVMLAYKDCARAMYQSWSVLGLGLAVFALSSFVPTQRFGAMMFCLLTAALIGNLLILPAVLCSPLAWFFGRGLMRKAQREKQELPEEEFGLEPAVHGPPKPAMAAPLLVGATVTPRPAGTPSIGTAPTAKAGGPASTPFRTDGPHHKKT